MTTVLFLAVCFLAYNNGANDNFKGVATIYGSGVMGYRAALVWGTACTMLGSFASIFLAEALLSAFSGKGLVPVELTGESSFLVAVAAGAGATVLLATTTGFPISTTHGLVGALCGAGVASRGGVGIGVLLGTFLGPLLFSPLVACLLGAAFYLIARTGRRRLGIMKEWCVCVGQERKTMPMPRSTSALALESVPTVPTVSVGDADSCRQRYAGHVLGVKLQHAVDTVHVLSAGVVSFARGLNDTPKIAALLLVVHALEIELALLAVGLVMAVGGVLQARKVAETMGHGITDMNHGQALAANLATGALVIFASRLGFPVSTTHVAVGSLFGIGAITKTARLRSVRNIALGWVITLPCAAILGAVAYLLVTVD